MGGKNLNSFEVEAIHKEFEDRDKIRARCKALTAELEGWQKTLATHYTLKAIANRHGRSEFVAFTLNRDWMPLKQTSQEAKK